MNVVIVLGKCVLSKKTFGIRVEEKNRGIWHCTWTFPIKDSVASREGYNKSSVSGSINILAEYPGCPTCKAQSFFKCGNCGKINCWDNHSLKVTCAWCGDKSDINCEGHINCLDGGKF